MSLPKSVSPNLENAIDQVLRRSAIDPDFRELAKAAPAEAMAKFDRELIHEHRIRFVEENGSADRDPYVFSLPRCSWAELQLSDLELEEFVGAQCGFTNQCDRCCETGCGGTCPCTACCITC